MERICSSCRKGWEGTGNIPYEDDNGYCPDVADPILWIVKDPDTGKIVLRGYLCESHQGMYLDDGYTVTRSS